MTTRYEFDEYRPNGIEPVIAIVVAPCREGCGEPADPNDPVGRCVFCNGTEDPESGFGLYCERIAR